VGDVGGKEGRKNEASYLHEVLLGPVYVSGQCVLRKFAGRYIRYTHVRRADGDEIADGRFVVTPDIRAKELPIW
jgi:hypothetical protein